MQGWKLGLRMVYGGFREGILGPAHAMGERERERERERARERKRERERERERRKKGGRAGEAVC